MVPSFACDFVSSLFLIKGRCQRELLWFLLPILASQDFWSVSRLDFFLKRLELSREEFLAASGWIGSPAKISSSWWYKVQDWPFQGPYLPKMPAFKFWRPLPVSLRCPGLCHWHHRGMNSSVDLQHLREFFLGPLFSKKSSLFLLTTPDQL